MTDLEQKPRLRFKGFTEAWEQRKLGEITGITKGQQINKSKLDNSGAYYVLNGGMSPSGYTDTFNTVANTISISEGGNSCGYINYNFEPFWSGGHNYTLLNPKIDAIYLYQVLKLLEPQIMALRVGSGLPNIQKNRLQEVEITFPKEEEQKKIGQYFSNLDNLITLHQRKYEKLKSMKAALLEKMFPSENETTPKIRFKGFTEAWEQRKLSELYEKTSRKNDLTYRKDDIISVANMYFKEDSYITDESYLLTYNIFELGDIAFEGNKSKNYAHGRFVENTIGNGIVSHVFDVFKPIMKPYDLQFWKYAINNEQLMGGILLRSTKASTMMTNLVANDFLQETFLTPTYPEQQKIGAFFQELDNLITLHQRKCEKLKNLKKSLLERMFI